MKQTSYSSYISPSVFLSSDGCVLFGSSTAMLMNSIYGPGMFVLPVAILNTGWVTVTVVNLLFCVLAAASSLMMAEAMARCVPACPE